MVRIGVFGYNKTNTHDTNPSRDDGRSGLADAGHCPGDARVDFSPVRVDGAALLARAFAAPERVVPPHPAAHHAYPLAGPDGRFIGGDSHGANVARADREPGR